MIEHKFTIPGTLPGLNDYLKAVSNTNRNYAPGNDMKRQHQMIISNAIRRQLKRLKIEVPVIIDYYYYEPNKKRDLDNIAGVAHKFIQDSLKECGVIKDDSQRFVVDFNDYFFTDRKNPRIEVVIKEVGGADG